MKTSLPLVARTQTASRLPWLAGLLCAAALTGSSSAQVAPKWEVTWTDHAQDPVDLKSTGSRAYMPYVLVNSAWPAGSRHRVWYDIESINGIGYSTSADGVTWSQGQTVTGLNTDGTSASGRPVVLSNESWAKPYRLYYYGNPGDVWQVRVAESADGVSFENDQVALEGGRLGTFPDGHAVVHIPGRTTDPADPDAARPFLMYFLAGGGIGYASSQDGYTFTQVEDDPFTEDRDEGLITITGLPEGTTYSAQPTQVLQIAQNDFRMFAFRGNTAIEYLVSAQ